MDKKELQAAKLKMVQDAIEQVRRMGNSEAKQVVYECDKQPPRNGGHD